MRLIKLYFLIAIIGLQAFGFICAAQDISAFATTDKDSIHAGQPIDYNIKINIPNGYTIDWTNINDTIGSSIEVLRKSEITELTTNNGENLVISRTLNLTTFDTGYIEIPRINLKYSKSEGDTNTYKLQTNPIDIYVRSVSIDTTMTYRDIKVPIKQKFTIEESLPYAGGILILAGIIALVLLLIKNFRKRDTDYEEEVKPKLPAIVIARERLSHLKDANLWQSGKLKEFYTDLTDIVREYLEGQFNIDAIEMTSDEILTEVKKIGLDDSTYNKLRNTILTADLVKFAKANTTSTQNEDSFNDINNFIEDSYIFHQELEKKKAEDKPTEKQEMEETK